MKSRSRIYVTRQIPQSAVDVLLQDCNVSFWDSYEPVPRGELMNNVRGIDALICMPTDKIDIEVLNVAGNSLKVIGTFSENCDHIDREECERRDIKIVTMTSFSTEIAADLTVAVIQDVFLAKLQSDDLSNTNVSLNKNEELSSIFKSQTLGLIGLGDTALAVGKRLRAKGVNKVVYNDFKPKADEAEINAQYMDFDKVLEESDIICICCRSNGANSELFNKETFHKMKNTAILVDAARGHVVKYHDLYQALREQQISVAAVDLREQGNIPFRKQLMGLNNCIFAPYQESNRWDKRSKASASLANVIVAVLKTGIVPEKCPICA